MAEGQRGQLDTVGAALVGAQPDEPIERAVSRWRAGSALFGDSVERPRIGRYHLIERAGAGGMGVVWAAYDPELDRAVAIKLLRSDSARGRDRMVAEGKALASLSHPNIVPVFDVGLHDEQVYLVMELVRGDTLRAHVAAEPRSAREIARIYRQAGEGLAAAHRAGLVHGDFKPDNAVIGSDGRVRVLDFGLARAVDGQTPGAEGTPAGTPRYMAPELAAGPASAAADQYAFCVSLREALTADAPDRRSRARARWLDGVIERGTQADPAARFPSMDEVVRALARDPRVVLRNRLLALGAAALVGGAFAIGRAAADEGPSCDGGRAAIASIWGPSQRLAVVDRLAAGADPYGRGVAPRIGAELDSYRDRWSAGHRDACMAHARGEQSDSLLDARMTCLARGKTALAATIDVLASAAGDALPGAVVAVGDLPELARCGDPAAVVATVSPPAAAIANQVDSVDADLERAQVLLLAARPEARDAAVAVVARARQLDYSPLLARALLVQGRVAMRSPQRADALAPLGEATTLALAAGDDALAVEAFARRAWVEATGTSEPDFDRATASLPLVEAIASRLQPPARFARALLYNNLGSIELARDRPPAARAAFERALREAREVSGPGSIELIKVRSNLALVVEPARREALLAEATREFTRALGDDHPMTLDVRITSGFLATDPREAVRRIEPACATYTRLHPTYGHKTAVCWFELGWLAEERGDAASLSAAMNEVVRAAAAGGDPQRAGLARAYLALAAGDPAAAIAGFADVLRQVGPLAGQPSWIVLDAADAELGAGLAHHAAGQSRSAEAAFLRARRHLEGMVAAQPHVYVERRLARTRAELARLLAARRASPAEIAAHASSAADWYRSAGGYDAVLDELAPLASRD